MRGPGPQTRRSTRPRRPTAKADSRPPQRTTGQKRKAGQDPAGGTHPVPRKQPRPTRVTSNVSTRDRVTVRSYRTSADRDTIRDRHHTHAHSHGAARKYVIYRGGGRARRALLVRGKLRLRGHAGPTVRTSAVRTFDHGTDRSSTGNSRSLRCRTASVRTSRGHGCDSSHPTSSRTAAGLSLPRRRVECTAHHAVPTRASNQGHSVRRECRQATTDSSLAGTP
jgi:hypothetical protein